MYTQTNSISRSTRRVLPVMAASLALISFACTPQQNSARAERMTPRLSLFLGIDVSGSFQATGQYDDAIRFTAHYIYGHMNQLGELQEPRALFVGSIGGAAPGETKSFHPIHDFKNKSVDEIDAALREWFKPDDRYTDFNAFFERVATLVKRQNLILTPLAIVVISDGVPDIKVQANAQDSPYRSINFKPLEYLSRNVTVRLLYANPTVAVNWETHIERNRVRMWTVDGEVMQGWREQIVRGVPLDEQDLLWQWISENIDFRVRRSFI